MSSYELPDFVTPHDGTQPAVPEIEQTIVAQKLKSLIDDVMLNHAESVKHFAYTHEDKVTLKVPDNSGADNSYWSVAVSKRTDEYQPNGTFPASESSRKEIYVQRVVDEYGRDHFAYRLFADGTVRRWDGGDAYGKIEEQRQMGIDPFEGRITEDMSQSEMLDATRKNIINIMANIVPNARLARQMGYNEQPVGLAELDGLTDMITQPGVVPK